MVVMAKTKPKKKQLVFIPDHENKTITHKGIKYILKRSIIGKDGHRKKDIFEEYDTEQYDKLIKKITNYVVKGSGITIEDVINDLLKYSSVEDLKKIEGQVKRKVKPKLKRGCIGVTMGKTSLNILE